MPAKGSFSELSCASLVAYAFKLMNFENATYSIHMFQKYLLKYMLAVGHQMQCSETCFYLAGMYLKRYHSNTFGLGINENTAQNLFLISLVISAKYIDDQFYSNRHYANIGEICLEKLNYMELSFASVLKFHFYTSEIEFARHAKIQASQLLDSSWILSYLSVPRDFIFTDQKVEGLMRKGNPHQNELLVSPLSLSRQSTAASATSY